MSNLMCLPFKKCIEIGVILSLHVSSLTRTSRYLTSVLDLFNSYFISKQEPKSKRGRPAAVAKGRKGAVAKNASAKATPVKRKAPTPPGMYNSNITL